MMLFLLLLFPAVMMARSTYDQLQPFGFATMNSRTENVTYNLTGGGAYGDTNQCVITALGGGNDDKEQVENAIKNHSVIILDGSNGKFTISQYIRLQNLSNKTIIGINNARLCTEFYLTDEIKAALDAADVANKSSSSGTGGPLYWHGEKIADVSEERELVTRQVLLSITEDKNEPYRKSGVFSFSGCENIIIRNIKFEGPGPIDCGGYDLLAFSGTTHAWVDHCEFTDGMDGNFDITNASDFITVSWCKFSYTSRAYMHMYTNLVGSGSYDSDAGKLNVTFAYNHWGTGCLQRMPLASCGKIHMLNNYYTCTGNSGPCISMRHDGELLVEGNYFDESISNIYAKDVDVICKWSTTNPNIANGASSPSSSGSVSVPYTYSTELAAANVPAEVGTYVGAVLYGASTASPAKIADINTSYEFEFGSDGMLRFEAYPVTSYQWYKDGVAIVGATGPSYYVNTLTASTAQYHCVATNENATGTSTVNSTVATVSVNPSDVEVYKLQLNGRNKEIINDGETTGDLRYFSYNSAKHNFSTNFNGCTYDGVTYTSGLKMESATEVSWTSTSASTVTIVQSTSYNGNETVKFDGSALSMAGASTEVPGCRIYTIENVEAGNHIIKQGSGQCGIFAVTVECTPAYEFTNPKKYALTSGSDAVASGTSVELKDGEELLATLTYGVSGGAVFADPKNEGSVTGYTAYTAGNGEGGTATSGTLYTIVPKYDAVISVAVVLNADKNFYILEDDVAMSGYNGITKATKYNGTFEFKATKDKTYKIYCTGSKLGFYGFEMRPYDEVTIGTGGYSTFAADKDFSVVGATVYKAQDNGASVTLTEMPQDTRYKAGEGIVLRATEGAKAQIAYTSIAASALTENDMVGVTESTEFTNDGYVYVIATLGGQTKFYKYTGDSFPAGKAYLHTSGSGGTDSLPVNFEEVTAVNKVSAKTNNSHAGVRKYFKDGKLFIESNGVRYNTTGARVR